MAIIVDHQIRELSRKFNMIDPFVEPISGEGRISYGLTSAGYDLRLGESMYVFKNTFSEIIDPKLFADEDYKKRVFDHIEKKSGPVLLPAHSYALVSSWEYLRIPRHLKARVVGKSTYARCGLIVNTTPLEPEWEGHLTIEVANASPCPIRLYVGEGIAQLEIETLDDFVETSYKDKKGQYQNQVGVTPARVKA
jgi:dCTP deaminase